jgi:hypothetical protein
MGISNAHRFQEQSQGGLKQPPYPEAQYYSKRLPISPEEEQGATPTDFGGIWVKTHRYSRRTFDPGLANEGLEKVQARLGQSESRLAHLETMKRELASCINRLDAELTYRKRFGGEIHMPAGSAGLARRGRTSPLTTD